MAVAFGYEDGTPVDLAIEGAVDPMAHTAADVSAVQNALEEAGLEFFPLRELAAIARAWLDGAAILRQRGLPATFTTIVAVVASGRGRPARMARDLIERAMRAEYDEELR
jgi:hypothetical protein